MCGAIQQCEACNAALIGGYVEMLDPLTERRVRVCFSCGIENLRIKRAMELDDLQKAGMLEYFL